jgi:hypothetical protein
LAVSVIFKIEQGFAKGFMIPPEPAAPTLIIERNAAALLQSFCQGSEVIAILKERVGLAEIRDSDSPFTLLIEGFCDHYERVGSEISAAPGFIQFGGVTEIVNPSVGPFKQKEPAAILFLAVRKHPPLQRSNVAPVRSAELQALVGKKCAMRCERFLVIRRSFHGSQNRFQIAPNPPLVRSIRSGEAHRFQSHQPRRQRLFAYCREPPQARTRLVRRDREVPDASLCRLSSCQYQPVKWCEAL